MLRSALIVTLLLLAGCARSNSIPTYASPQEDPMYQEIKGLVLAISNCFMREAKSKSIAHQDLNTAAYAVMGRCSAERQRLKAFQAGHDIRSVPQLETYWAQEDAKDLETIRQMIAVIRTGSR